MRSIRMLALAVCSAAPTRSLALLTFWYFSNPQSGVVFFPSAGLTLAALLLTRRRTWPLWLAAVAVAEISIDLAHGQTLFMAVGFATANVVEPLVAATLISGSKNHLDAAPRRYLLRYVACAVIIGPLVGGLIGGPVAAIAGTGDFASTAAKWWLGDAIGVLVVATPVLAWRAPRSLRGLGRTSRDDAVSRWSRCRDHRCRPSISTSPSPTSWPGS